MVSLLCKSVIDLSLLLLEINHIHLFYSFLPLCRLLPDSGDGSKVKAGIISHLLSDRIQGNCLKMHQEIFRLVIRKNFMVRVVRHLNRFPREEVESSALVVCKKCVDVVLKDMF